MANKPIVLTVDDDPHVLGAIDRDLRQRFGAEYRILKATSGAEALDAVRELSQRNTPVALFLADQRMPQMTGAQFLEEALRLYPDAKRVLLTAYADTEAAIASINRVGLDYYLMKPWDPPEQNLYPVLEDLLDEWQAHYRPPFEGIRVAGTLWSAQCHDSKDFLSCNLIPYQWLDVEMDEQARVLVETAAGDALRLPVVFFPDGEVLIQPDRRTLAKKLGLQTAAAHSFYDLIIIGGGPAGLAAAVYGGSEGLRTLMIERSATGGQAGTSSRIENYLGFPKGLSGGELARRATSQAKRFGVEIVLSQEVMGIRVEDSYRIVTLEDGKELACHALLIATGVATRKLDVPGIESVTGAGAYYGAAMTEATFYRDCDVFVVGGANSAGQGAMFFSRYAHSVTMLVRSNLAKEMSQYLIDQIHATSNISILEGTEICEVHGRDRLEAITIRSHATGDTRTVPAAAMFIFIGAKPHTDLLAGLVERDEDGFILTGMSLFRGGRLPKTWKLDRDPFLLETSVPGIFAAGDVRHGSSKRIASAVGEGAVAVQLIHRYLATV